VVTHGVIPVSPEMVFPVRANQNMELGAITLYLDYDPSRIEITGMEMPDNGGEEPWFEAKDGVLYIGWMSTNPVRMENEETLLLIHARLTEEFQISNLNSEISNLRIENRDLKSEISFALNDSPLSDLADPEGNVISDVTLTIPKGENGKTVNWQNGKMEVVNVYPNPTKESLNIELLTESDGPVTLELVSVQGVSAMKNQEFLLKAGWNWEQVNISGVAPGVYMLKVTCGDVTEIRKVIVNR
jgi:hypothetical protein